jgi:type VI secretion system protein ImpJ
MSDPAVYWHEGMLLRPQHFQAADRHLQDRLRWASQWDRPYHWGLRSIKLDPDALKAARFKVQRLEARLRDGTIVRVPDDGLLPDRDLRPYLTSSDPVEVALGVPVLRPGAANVGTGPDSVTRYQIEPVRDGTPDENTGQATRPGAVLFRRLTLHLLVTGKDDPAGYETLPLAQVDRSGMVGATPRLAPSYIPPLLACDAWDPLRQDVLEAIDGRIASLVETYAKRVRGRARFGSSNPEEVLTLEKFRILNELRTYFRVLVGADGVHPFDAYLELCRMLGRLAILGKGLPTFDPPAYNHDDLGPCFTRVKQDIDELLSRDFDQGYEQQEFVGVGKAMKAPFKPAWLAPNWEVYVGVSSTIPSADCARYLQGRLNMKVAAYNRVEDVFKKGLQGLEFKYTNSQPQLLPDGPDMTYFRINRDSSAAEWVHVQNTLEVAVRLNEDLILETMEGKTNFALRFDNGKTVRMSFTLYVVPPSSVQPTTP